MDHFELFGLPRRVDVDVKALEQRFRELSMELHPDRLVGADARDRRIAAERTASLNEGVKILRDPVRRAFYLLKLKGVDVESEQAAAKLQMPMEFLEEIMERREALERVKAAKDLDEAHRMAAEIRSARDAALATARAALETDDVPAAAQALGRVRYYVRFLEEVDAFEEELMS
ncbi:MAG: Fe-S protein assembly co-chaperone HscB [Myxococcota bacterium]|jgi:molecular chaperone HscB